VQSYCKYLTKGIQLYRNCSASQQSHDDYLDYRDHGYIAQKEGCYGHSADNV
jgi:hypothetical protein